MSLDFYAKHVPDKFKPDTPNDGTAQPSITETGGAVLRSNQLQRKFADVTDVKTRNISGEGNEVVLTDKFCPLPKRNEKAIKKFEEYSVLLRRNVRLSRDGRQYVRSHTDLEIQSETLQEAVRSIIKDSWENEDLESSPIKIPWPYCELFFARKEIQAFVEDESKSENVRNEVKILQDFIEDPKQDLSKTVLEYAGVMEDKQVTGMNLWTLFPPNKTVVFKQPPVLECYICRTIYYKTDATGAKWWEFKGARVDFNGDSAGLSMKTYIIPFFSGKRKILDLPLIPTDLDPDWPTLKERLISRGISYSEMLAKGFQHRHYTGPAWEYDEDTFDLGERPTFQVSNHLHLALIKRFTK
jgi:hypothetical protein